jgi:YggT family protein
MVSLLILIDTVISLYVWLIIASIILSWLVAFRVINTHNQFVATVGDFLYRVTEPALGPIRRFMPDLGGIDLAPLVLVLLLFFLRNLIGEMSGRLMM